MENGTQTLKAAIVKKEFDQSVYVMAMHGDSTQMVYETRSDDGDEGILIDTGAAINCVGGNFCERYDALMEARGAPPTERVTFEPLPAPHFISGLGRGTTRTDIAACIPCHARGLGRGQTYFKGAYLEGQSSPAILGMCSLRSLNGIVDCREGREALYVSPSGHDFEIVQRHDQGRRLELATAKSGHIMLPISGYGRNYIQELNTASEEDRALEEEEHP